MKLLDWKMSAAEETNLQHTWDTGKTCACGDCHCCTVYRAMPRPMGYADREVQDRRVMERRSANAWNRYMTHRLNNN